MSNAVFTLRLPDDVKADLERLARATNRSKSYLAARAIAAYVRANAWQIEALQKAAREADQGAFVSGQAVDAWLESWGTDEERSAPEADIRPKPTASRKRA